MEIEEIRQELNRLLKNVTEHSEIFSGGRPIPSLEINAVLSKINKMQERLIVLKHLLETQEKEQRLQRRAQHDLSAIKEETDIHKAPIIEEKVSDFPIINNEPVQSNPIQEIIEKTVEKVNDFTTTEEIIPKEVDTKPEPITDKTTSIIKELDQSSPIQETFEKINDFITKEEIIPNEVDAKLESIVDETPAIPQESETPIEIPQGSITSSSSAKIVDAITLNDRYLYANELFNKNMTAFNNLVKSIDCCNNLTEAKALYLPLNWDNENEHVHSFIELVEKRFL